MVKDDVSEPEQMRKLFIGGLDYRTTDQSLKEYFEQFGEIVDVVVMKDPNTKRSRGFGFVAFSSAYMVDEAQKQRPHKIDGRSVDTKRAVPRDEISRSDSTGIAVKKLFVGGLKEEVEEADLREEFAQFGEVVAVNIPTEKETQKKRGFAFVEFDSYEAVEKALKKEVRIRNRKVDVKKAHSKNDMQSQGRGGGGGGRGGGGGPWGGGGRNDNAWGNNQNSGGGGGGWDNQSGGNWGGQNSYGQSGYNQGSSYGGQQQQQQQPSSSSSSWQGNSGGSQGWGGNQGGGGGGSQPWSGQPSNSYSGSGSASSTQSWQQPSQDFGNNYGQSYGGGPMRNQQSYGSQPNRSAPYSSGGGSSGYSQHQSSGGYSGSN